ncbi:MAG: hypothetical protein H0V44_08760 [Planctomycetes bacterium]|nr:hypothetical protein [Planctomycetota bacterium]
MASIMSDEGKRTALVSDLVRPLCGGAKTWEGSQIVLQSRYSVTADEAHAVLVELERMGLIDQHQSRSWNFTSPWRWWSRSTLHSSRPISAGPQLRA